jgi:uncharacterized membrane protein
MKRSEHLLSSGHLGGHAGLRRGFAANLPVAASVAAYGSVLGVLAAQKHISWFQLLVMNVSVFAGSAQFVMVDMWVPPLPIAEMTLPGTLLVSLVAPSVLAAGPSGVVAACCTAAVAYKTKNVFLAMMVGMGVVTATRRMLPG